MLHGTGNIYLRKFTISSSHPCRYNPRSLTLRPVEKCQTWQRLSPASFWGFSGLWPIFRGFCWKKLPDTSRSSSRPILPSFPACRPFVTGHRHRDVTFGSASQHSLVAKVVLPEDVGPAMQITYDIRYDIWKVSIPSGFVSFHGWFDRFIKFQIFLKNMFL